MNWLSGYRTYIFAVSTVAGALLLWVDGKITLSQFVLACGPAIAAVWARLGAKNDVQAVINALADSAGASNTDAPAVAPTAPVSGTAPKLPAIILAFAIPFSVLMSGCVDAKIHETALKLDKALSTLHSATIPSPRYSDPHDTAYDPSATAKVEGLWMEAHGAVADIEEASK